MDWWQTEKNKKKNLKSSIDKLSAWWDTDVNISENVLVEMTLYKTEHPPILNWGAKLQQVTPRSWASFSACRRLTSVSQSLRSPRVQPVTNIWPQGEKQQATTLASLTSLHLFTTMLGHTRLGQQRTWSRTTNPGF